MSEASPNPVLSLVRAHPFSTACAIVSILCAGASIYFWNEVSNLDETRAQREKEGEAALEKLVSGPPMRQELAAVREVTQRIDDNLVTEDNLAENLWYFYKIEEQSKARLRELRQLSSIAVPPDARYRKVPYSLSVLGTYSQVYGFLRAIETGPHLANISSFSIKRHDNGSPVIELDLGLELLGRK